MRHRLVSIFFLILACAAVTLVAFARQPGSTVGSYNCIVGGDFSGDGNVYITSATIKLDIPIRDKDGRLGRLQAQVSVANNRFAGDGTVMGVPMKIQGRLDPADDQQRGEQLRGQRLVATFSDTAKHHGRITGSPRLRGGGSNGGGGSAGSGGGGGGGGGSTGSGGGGEGDGDSNRGANGHS